MTDCHNDKLVHDYVIVAGGRSANRIAPSQRRGLKNNILTSTSQK